jgi:hypothetical protein
MVAVLEAVPRIFPEELRTPELTTLLADAMAATIETYDGQPYRELFVQGSCDEGGLQRCDVTVSGLPSFAARDEQDTYLFEVRNGSVSRRGEPQRRGFPTDLTADLDAVARRLDTGGLLSDRTLLNAEWLPEPPNDAYVLFYGNGNEEGDPTVVVRIDRGGGMILDIHIRS